MFRALLIIIAVCSATLLFGQQKFRGIDKLFDASPHRFCGVVLIAEGENIVYSRAQSDAYVAHRGSLNADSRFIIGSVSKQITAVLILQAYETGLLKLHIPIGNYLPDLPSWRDSVTIHHLLTHTHGINEDNISKPLAFVPGARFDYSQVGFDLLAKILEQVTGKTFAALSGDLFKRCGMTNSGVPGDSHVAPVQGYRAVHDKVKAIDTPYYVPPVAAGNFISSAADLLKWNNFLHGGKLLNDSTYRMMITPQPNAIRQHPIFGPTLYGYGITIDSKDGLTQFGQTGLRAGYSSMDFYFPATKTSVIVLSNVQYDDNDIKKLMAFHTGVLDLVRAKLKGAGPSKK